MSSFIHQALKNRDKANYPYMSSVLINNKDVPLFEEVYGCTDLSWCIEATENRTCTEVKPCVIRYVDGKNLSLKYKYRMKDFFYGLRVLKTTKAKKRWYSTYARYHYFIGHDYVARIYFKQGVVNWKTVLYYLTSYSSFLRKIIIKLFNVFG